MTQANCGGFDKQKVIIPKAYPNKFVMLYVHSKKQSEFISAKATGRPVVGGKYTS
jgi:hypothetical protein